MQLPRHLGLGITIVSPDTKEGVPVTPRQFRPSALAQAREGISDTDCLQMIAAAPQIYCLSPSFDLGSQMLALKAACGEPLPLT